MGSHIVDGEFQSDKYPTTPRGKVPLSVKDVSAQDLLWIYAQRRRAVDAEFANDLETALLKAGFTHGLPDGISQLHARMNAAIALCEEIEADCVGADELGAANLAGCMLMGLRDSAQRIRAKLEGA